MLQCESLAPATRHALKEWSVAVDSLRDGDSLVTVRKGGIREAGREFRTEHRTFALFPTYEHQNAGQIGERHVNRLEMVLAEAPASGTLRLHTWAEVTDAVEVTSEEAVRAVAQFSVFSPAYALERLQWRPKKPLHILVLRVHRLAEPLVIPMLPEYGGCKSWIELAADVPLQPSTPALDQAAFEAARCTVLEALHAAG